MTEPLLRVSGISKRFGGLQALSNVSLDANAGEIVGLIGPNGAGKTTLFSNLVGLHRPDSGSVRLQGKDLVGLKPHRIAAAGMVKTFQNVALFLDSSVLDNVLTGGLMRRSVDGARDLARQCLERVGISAIADKLARDLSFPERARVEVARALCTEPRVLLLDEAMAALNHVEMDEFMALLRQLREEGLTLIIVEHHMRAIMSLCQRLVVLNFGQLIATGTPTEISRNPAVIEAYLGRSAAA
ncbi:ABC transporter ATP-binding protein [Bradyrhizobium sp. U87765 SZCCT0131]|uniref:ABC transporter ATP-binding protein n=1 Tax=unclassified Bradyrhizobium TaxID=2631580 RepID=UPI001BAC1EAA|nr:MULTISPECIES: ABC transporter ATP-binding protein [unclassified Bradyrhizobium]MBR1220392.1 ABC transporter ATP-binding protein [Bradyrhizobium sp. U87765 SZCCT0131]MBR1263153.1 ABC transporter ATP-binding protein [Bradyrhizobium sp. U87765 SZCCT0134]MBR1306964.1 ABC transporter ATP-binding protein [Bradyrhizobium sp. U87765 SZCCT0110]MBR1323463.1 ABC transporter ATP-binding protein [Bradyrhizobium sp. U87765 SZCCT0109]MBR1345918.1 ABC transporter ATP-binding protein [Bradyrhizobium sp. U87